jgi:hypothetical protein
MPNDPAYDELENDLNLASLMDSEFDKDKERLNMMMSRKLYDYEPISIDLKDIAVPNRVDAEHTRLLMYNNNGYTIKLPFERLIQIYSELLGVEIYDLTGSEKKSQKLIAQNVEINGNK